MAKYSKNSDTECVSHVADTTHFDGKDSTDKGVGIRTLATEGKASQHVRVGVGVLVKDPTNPQKIFVGMRKNSHGAGKIALPGGHLEMYETWEECAIREVKEEANLNIHNVSFGFVTNDMMVSEGKHYVTIFMTAEVREEESEDGKTIISPENMEPHKCDGWYSLNWDDLCRLQKEDKLFAPLNHLVMEKPSAIINFMQHHSTFYKNR